MREQRSGIPLMIIALLALLLSAAAVVLIFDPFGWLADGQDAPPSEVAEEPVEEQPEPEPEPELMEEPQPEPEPEPEPEPAAAVIPATRHTVRERDTLSDISTSYWGDPNLWPLLYQENQDSVVDPDYLTPGQVLVVPEWIEAGPIDGAWLRELSEAHVTAHRMYAALGDDAIGLGAGQPRWWLDRLGRERANKALWVLYSGLRYNRQLLDEFSAQIDAASVRQVRAYIDRFGYPPGS